MKDKIKAYTAGLLDGDGYITIIKYKQSYLPRVGVVNASLPLMKWLVGKFGGTYRKQKKRESHRICYEWQTTCRAHSMRFLFLIRPYLTLKRQKADIVFSYLQLNGWCAGERERIYQKYMSIKDSPVTTNVSSFPYKQNVINAYFSGLFDAEGFVGINKLGSGFRSRIALGMTHKGLPKTMQFLYDGNFYVEPTRNRKTCYRWTAENHDLQERFLLQVLPYAIVKREQMKLVLQYVRLHHQKDKNDVRRSLYKQIVPLQGLQGKR